MTPGEKDGRPPAPGAPSGGKDLEREVERLAVPERSLLERDGGVAAVSPGEHRANPLSVVVEALKMASGLVVLMAFGLAGDFFAGDLPTLATLVLAAAGIFAACLALSLVVWRVRTWELTDEGVVMRWGLLNKRQLTIPYEHIHTADMSSELLDRLFGLMTLDLDTGAAAAEGDAARMRGLRAGEAEALRAELFRRKRAAGSPAGEKDGAPAASDDGVPDERPLATFELAGRQLLLAAASQTSAASQAVALVVLLVNGLNQLIEWGVLDLAGTGDELVATALPVLVPAVAAFVLAAIVLGAAVSFVLGLVRYAGYRVERYADRVVVEHGLLSRSSRTVAVDRVQHVVVRQGIIRQLVGYAEVYVQVVSAPGEADGEPSGSVLLHPFVRMGELDALLAEVLPAYAGVVGQVELRRLGPVACRRAVVRAAIWWPFATAIFFGVHWLFGLSGLLASAGWLLGPLLVAAVLLSVVLLAGLVVDALLAWRGARYGHTARELVLVSGGFTRRTTIAPRSHLQRMQVSASPFQRRAGVATLSARTAASDAEGLELRDVPADDADALLAWFRPRG
ncbi:PH domain-containing protein [Olsenella sp. DSM 107455]|uniref:PH domain-containing protein n=1 Tax=Thermophilibacter gallinarum TaxID=2779357 RepID=A0ABR9QQX1_9ACTN|nr:PH domain-containing protein [Thermophilibacter gallinarum]